MTDGGLLWETMQKYARSNPSNYDKYLKSSKFVFDGSYF